MAPFSLRPHTGAKKLIVKNLRTHNRSRDSALQVYYKKLWSDIDAALTDIFEGRDPRQPYDGLYKAVEDLCRHGEAEALYKHLHGRKEEHLKSLLLPELESLAKIASTDDLVIGVVEATWAHWKVWTRQAATIRNVFSFLDRSYLLPSRQYQQLNDLAIALFKRIIFGRRTTDSSVAFVVMTGMCLLVKYQRQDSSACNSQLLKNSVSMINILSLYTRFFEPALLKDSQEYFLALAADAMESHSLTDYVMFCCNYRVSEEERSMIFNFDSSTKKQLIEQVNRIFVVDAQSKLLDGDAISHLLRDKNVETMKLLYHLLKQSNLEKGLKSPWEAHIRLTGSNIINDTTKVDEMVVRLLLLRRDLDVMIWDAFDGSEEFIKGLREAFAHFVNDKKMNAIWGTKTSKVGEMVAKYIDKLLRGGLKALPPDLLSDSKSKKTPERSGNSQDAELDRQLDSALELFRFIQGKDVFEAFYKKDLARRLLMNRSASQDAERSMLAKLRGECGSSFTQNLEQMFKDRELANEDMRAYREKCGGRKGRVDLEVSILSAAAWPSYPDVPCKLPLEVYKEISEFDKYYLGHHTGRRLIWKHNMAQCVIRASLSRGFKELLVSGFQAVVLLLFNHVQDGEELSYAFISHETGIPSADLNLALQSLACGKTRILTKKPKGKDVHSADRFVVNMAFWDPKFRIKINMIQMKETPQENQEIHERVAADRMFETQAAIVRVMKNRKRITHNELVAEVINATKKRGVIDVAVIKQNIERLIDKDYMERDPDSGEYVYMA